MKSGASSKGKPSPNGPMQFSLFKYFSTQESIKETSVPNTPKQKENDNTINSQEQCKNTGKSKESTHSPMQEEARGNSESSYTFGASRVIPSGNEMNQEGEFTFGFDKNMKKIEFSKKKNALTSSPRIEINEEGTNQLTPQSKTKKARNSQIQSSTSEQRSKSTDKSAKFVAPQEDLANETDDPIPFWALPENRLDSKKRPVSHPDHDPTTLHIPRDEFEKMTPSVAQYWLFKSKNFDKVVLFKLGKFYELFYEDALVGVRLLGLRLMGKKMHAGFPEKALIKYASKFSACGYKCVIVEQIETPKQQEERVKKDKPNKFEKIAKREVTQVLTPGTHQDMFHDTFNPKYLWVFQSLGRAESYCLIVVEASNYQARLIFMEEDKNIQFLKTAFLQLRPDEVAIRGNFVDPVVLKMFQTAFFQPHMTFLTDSKDKVYWNFLRLDEKIEEIKQSNFEFATNLESCLGDPASEKYFRENLNALIEYFRELYLFEKFKLIGRVEVMNPEHFRSTCMYIDSQAIAHLNIFEIESSEKEAKDDSSLFSFIDHASSQPGRRLLKKWLCQPSIDPEVINQRLDALEDLESVSPLRENFMSTLKGLLDLERMSQRLYTYAVKHNPNIQYFENVSETRLKELRTFFKEIKIAVGACGNLLRNNAFKSKRLNYLLNFQENGGMLPQVSPIIKEIEKQIIWEGDIPTPAIGLDKEYDALRQEGEAIQESLNQILEENRARFECKNINFAHTKAKYELEIPEDVVKKKGKPSGYEFSSKKQGFSRFTTLEIKIEVQKIDDLEERIKNTLAVFVKYIFNVFLRHRESWTQAIDAFTEVDVLCGLSACSFSQRFPMVRPSVTNFHTSPFIFAKGLRHPILAKKIPGFKENDLEIGTREDNRFMFLTGPNMGGKSTILRQVCLSAILAQIGCYVPAEEYQMSLVDRVFTRLGASDRLIEDKSTFFIEMEETANILKEATQHSLAMIDELGRGTSTFDGVAICHGFVEEMIQSIKCRTMFATHYHMLIETCQKMPISFCFMDIHIHIDPSDNNENKVILLHKLVPGIVRESQGINTAKIAGVDQETVSIAREKAKEFEFSIKFANMTKITRDFEGIMSWVNEFGFTNGNPASSLDERLLALSDLE